MGKAAAEETVQDIEDALEGVNMCFIAAGMGGGTGTGAAPVIAEAARRKGVLTVGVVTKPFLFEGTRRMRAAEAGIEELQRHVDTLIVIPNQNLFLIAKADTTFKQAFELADEVLQQGVRSITDLMVMPGLINLDFADVRSVMTEMGKAMMGTGEGEGENRALEAAEHAIANPLLDGVSMQGAKGVIISIIGGEDMKLLEVDEAANHIRELVDEDANIIWGSAFNPDLDGKIRVSVVATGIDGSVEMLEGRSESYSQSANRGGHSTAPKRPVLDLPQDDYGDDHSDDFDAEPEPAPVSAMARPTSEDRSSMLELGGSMLDDNADTDTDIDTSDEGDSFADDADVDGIVDPLAGLRQPESDDALPEPAPSRPKSYDDTQFGSDGGADTASEAPLDLTETESNTREKASDDLLDNADKLSRQDDEAAKPASPPLPGGRRRGLVSGSDGGKDSDGAGSTLFERMANLSRGGSSSDDDDDDDGEGAALSIPRFLGRQNNQ